MASASDLSDNLSSTFSLAGPRKRINTSMDGTDAGNKPPGSVWLDRVGIVLSVVCAVHCALTPVLIAVAPLVFSAEFEGRTKVVLVLLASVALIIGFASHRSWKPVYWLAVALGLLGLSHWWESLAAFSAAEGLEIATTVLASGALIMAHLANTRACRTSTAHGH